MDLDWTLTGFQTATRASVAETLITCGPGLDLDWFARRLQVQLYLVSSFLYLSLYMVFLVGASCLDNAFNSLERLKQKGLMRKILAIQGLSLNPQALDPRKKLQNFLLRSKTEKLVIWHDVISNSISKHRSNRNRPCQTKKLLDILCSFKNRIEAILYVQRANSPNILQKLKSTGILVLDVKTRLTSIQKRNNLNFIADLQKIHANIGTGRKLLHTILKNQYNLRNLIRKKRSLSKNRPSQRRRKKTQKKQKQSSVESRPLKTVYLA